MTLIIASVIAAALLIVISKMPVAMAMAKSEGGYDNRYPRDQQAALTGFGKRALAAHQNSLEAFPLFGVGVVLALWAQANLATTSYLCTAFIAARVAYLICYWMDIHMLRSTVWSVGFIASVWLMALALP